MKKIDLHIHTHSADSECSFDFDMERLQEYVKTLKIDCIAITNHNEFHLIQFVQIQKALDVLVLPGIEIDLEGGQILLIGPDTDLADFDSKCQKVTDLNPNKRDSISVAKLKEIFGDLSKYLLIPHYDKNPAIKDETLNALGPHVTAGEVASPKKFMYCFNNDEKLVPVYFSDVRIEASLVNFPARQTYIACEELTLATIKNCLRDKNKVALSPSDGNKIFQVFDDGQQLSTGLNVVLGGRSTGKSFTLERILKVTPNAKYIPQFSLVARDQAEDEQRFNRFLNDNNSLFSQDYLADLKNVVNDVLDIDLDENLKRVDEYLTSLKKHANETVRHDAFSRAKLFNEEKYPDTEQNGLEELIASTQNLIKNIEFKSVVEKHVSIQDLKALIVELMTLYGEREQTRQKRKWVNGLVADIKAMLQIRTSATTIPDLDLYAIAMDEIRISKFEQLIRKARARRELMRRGIQGFQLVATAGEFEGAGQLKLLSRLKSAFSGAFGVYSEPYRYLQELRKIDGLAVADLHKYFVKIDFKILNQDGYEASGGERSEFNLLQEIQDALQNEMLLIDEPESSFDNIFLNESVNDIIREISKSIPVVLVTHNNTVGASIKPDYLLFTNKETDNGKIVYRVYSGFPTNKKLRSVDGKTVSTWEVAMGCLEAGADAYDDRRRGYEDIKD
ncbi:MAG: histidinol-phosphatase [Rhodospirillales bacterium]